MPIDSQLFRHVPRPTRPRNVVEVNARSLLRINARDGAVALLLHLLNQLPNKVAVDAPGFERHVVVAPGARPEREQQVLRLTLRRHHAALHRPCPVRKPPVRSMKQGLRGRYPSASSPHERSDMRDGSRDWPRIKLRSDSNGLHENAALPSARGPFRRAEGAVFVAVHESGFGTKRTCRPPRFMSARRCEADMAGASLAVCQ
jgi:hypothetical protein